MEGEGGNFVILIFFHSAWCHPSVPFPEVEMYCRKQSKNIFKDKEKYEKQRKQQGPLGDHLEGEQSFFSVCKEDECDNKSVAELY